MKTRLLTIILISAVTFAVSGYWFGKLNPNIQSSKGNSNTSSSEALLEFSPIEAVGIAEAEQKKIEKFIETFEGYKLQKNPDKLLEMFSPPESKEEQDTLNSILGKDYAQGSAKLLTRLFSTQGYNHSIGGYYIRGIRKNNDIIVVAVDELRMFYRGLSEDFVGYLAKVSNLVLEIEEGCTGHQISRYYHFGYDKRPKYEGFAAY